MDTVGTPVWWVGFLGLILGLLALDLGVFRRRAAEPSLREAAAWTVVWVAIAAAFGGVVALAFGPELAVQFASGYILEEALSVDNVFVFSVILTFFAVPKKLQHRVLFWGILGALILRGVFIFAGSAILAMFHWFLYVFGALLVYTGIKLLRSDDDDVDPSNVLLVRIARRILPIVEGTDAATSADGHPKGYRGEHFWVYEDGRWKATLLFVVLLAIEGSDVVFAVDSIPAVFSQTRDPFIVYTSNIFAILGLRSLFFLVAGMMDKFHYLKIGLSAVLIFIGTKMLIEELWKIPTIASLAVIAILLAISMVASLLWAPKEEAKSADQSS
jgi:tellurite resistance protein TerC